MTWIAQWCLPANPRRWSWLAVCGGRFRYRRWASCCWEESCSQRERWWSDWLSLASCPTCGTNGGWIAPGKLIWTEGPGLLYTDQRSQGFCHKTRKWHQSRRWEDYRTVRSAQPPQQSVPLLSQDPPHQSRHTATYHHHYHIIIILIRKHVVLEFIKQDCSLQPISGKYQILVWICISVAQYTQSYNPIVLHSLHFDDNFFPLSIKDDGRIDVEGRSVVLYIRISEYQLCKACQHFIIKLHWTFYLHLNTIDCEVACNNKTGLIN